MEIVNFIIENVCFVFYILILRKIGIIHEIKKHLKYIYTIPITSKGIIQEIRRHPGFG